MSYSFGYVKISIFFKKKSKKWFIYDFGGTSELNSRTDVTQARLKALNMNNPECNSGCNTVLFRNRNAVELESITNGSLTASRLRNVISSLPELHSGLFKFKPFRLSLRTRSHKVLQHSLVYRVQIISFHPKNG